MFDEKDMTGENDPVSPEDNLDLGVENIERSDYVQSEIVDDISSVDFSSSQDKVRQSEEFQSADNHQYESETFQSVEENLNENVGFQSVEESSDQYGSFQASPDVQRPYERFAESSNYDDYIWNSPTPPEPEKKHKSSKFKVALAMVVGICVLVLGITTIRYGLNKIGNSGNSSTNTKIGSTSDTGKENLEQITTVSPGSTSTYTGNVVITDVSDVVKDVMPSIVAITSKTVIDSGKYGFPYGWGQDEQEETTGAGSGIIIHQTDTELLIVTNNHVVEGADSLSVQFINNKSVEASVKGTDSENDLAIVAIPLDKIDEDTLSTIKKATLGDSTNLRVGEGVIAIGNALGYGQSVTTGVISALDREVQVDNTKNMTMLQTDAAINGGNSGGALLNANGEVVGINAAKYSSSTYSSASIEGMGFAIPISSTTDIINELINKETRAKVPEADRGYLGIYRANISSEDAELYSMPEGVLVSKLIEGGAAEKAGIEPKDIIVKVAGDRVKTMDQIKEVLTYYAKGDVITVTIKYQDGKEYKEKDVEVTLQANQN